MSLEEATARAPALNVSEEELWQIVKSIDQRPGQQPEFELVASSTCWTAATDSADSKLRMVLAHSLGRSLLLELPEARACFDSSLQIAVEIGDREGAETAATNLHRLSTKATVAGNEPAVPFDEAVSARELRGTSASETTRDVDHSASEGDVGFLTAIRPDMYMPVVEFYVAHPPRGWDPEKWAKQLARLTASFQFGNAEQLADAVGTHQRCCTFFKKWWRASCARNRASNRR